MKLNALMAALLAVSGCSQYENHTEQPQVVDADPAVDTQGPDAEPPRWRQGCNMGNLPNSRTITVGDDDPIPSGLLNELQDVAIGAKRGSYPRTFVPVIAFDGGVSPWACVTHPSGTGPPALMSTSSGDSEWWIPFEPGETITGIVIPVFGNGSADIIGANIRYYPTVQTGPVALATWTDTNRTPVWANVPIGVFTPQLLAVGSYLTLRMSVNASGYYFNNPTATFIRL